MRLNDLERALARIPAHPAPRVELEQYATPADVAAPLLFEAQALGDITGRRVVDLGAGTGIFAIGAAILGAAEVEGVDVDQAALDVARRESERAKIDVVWRCTDITNWKGSADTVLMNPPFGAQRPGADRPFLEAAFASAPIVYILHHAPARAFVERFAAERGRAVTHAWRLRFRLAHQYRHQAAANREIEVIAMRFAKSDTESR